MCKIGIFDTKPAISETKRCRAKVIPQKNSRTAYRLVTNLVI